MSERVRSEPPHIPTAAERVIKALRRQHERIAIDLGRDDEKAPAWFAHLPGGGLFRVHYIGTWGPLVRFTGFGASTTDCDYVLVAPEQVALTIKTLPPDSDEPRRPIGFLADFESEPPEGSAT